MLNNSSASTQKKPLITEMIFNFRFLLTAETMPFTSEQCSWDHQQVSLQRLSSILDQSTWQSPVYYVMIALLELLSSRNTIHLMVDLSKETKCTRDARRKLMTCTNQTLNKFCPKLHQSWLMDLPSCRASSGKTTLAYNLLRRQGNHLAH